MVSFDILLEIREYFKTGHPLTNVIRAKMAMMQMKCKEVINYDMSIVWLAAISALIPGRL